MTVIQLPSRAAPDPALTSPAAGRTADSAPGPRDAARLVGLDVARGLAILGMAAAHVASTDGDLGTVSGLLSLSHGRSSILFALLAGISFGLMTGARTPYTGLRALQARTRILVRSAMLVAVVSALALLGTPVALILGYYAVWFVLALPFARWPFRRLLVTGLLVGVLGSAAAYYVGDLLQRLGWHVGGDDGLLTQTMLGTYPGLMWMGFVLVGLALSRLDLGDRGTLLRILAAGVLVALLGHGLSWVGGAAGTPAEGSKVPGSGSVTEQSYESSGMGGPGEGSGSAQDPGSLIETQPDGAVIDWTTQTVTLPDGTVLEGPAFDDYYLSTSGGGIGTGGPSFDTSAPLPRPDALLVLTPHSSTPAEFLGFGGTAAAVVALCLLLPPWSRRITLPLAAVGAMSLTAYCAHVVMLYLWPGYFLDTAHPDGNWPYAVMVGSIMLFALAWRFTLGRGPLEALLRTVSVRAASIER